MCRFSAPSKDSQAVIKWHVGQYCLDPVFFDEVRRNERIYKQGKAILISGHDLKDLEELLKQTEGKSIYVYTHGEMLPTHAYPELKKYEHLYGHYGTAWQNQTREFSDFPGAILMTTNCIQRPKESYKNNIFTCGLVGWSGVTHIADRNFQPVIDQALAGRPLTVFGDGTQTRSFSYVSDTVEAIIMAMCVDKASGEVLNLGSCTETQIIDLAKIILELTGSASDIEFHPLPIDDPKRRCPDISKIKKILGWQPISSLEKGLKRTIRWFEGRRS